jgi:hypothetical protein
MLLRNFSFQGKGKQQQIHVFDKVEERSFSPGLDNIVAERSFYDFTVDGQPQSIEGSLSEMESKTEPIVRKLLATHDLKLLTNAEHSWMSIFFACQFVRTKQHRELIRSFQAGIEEKIQQMGHDPTKIEGYFSVNDPNELRNFP